MISAPPQFGRWQILERREIRGAGFDALARGPDGREVRLWVGGPGSGQPGSGCPPPESACAALAAVYQAGLPRVLGEDVVEGRAVLVLQAYRGPTLAERLAGGPLEPTEAIDRVRSVAAALVKAHRAGIVHGAIGTEEILLAEDGRTLLLYTGFGPFLEARGQESKGEADDVFALARVLGRCLLGADFAPHPTEDSLPPGLPQGLRRLVARALHADPARRLRRAEELAGDLAVIRASWGATPRASGRLGGRAVAVALGIAAVLAAAFPLRSCLREGFPR